MPASVETHVDKPCDICGVTGVVEAIATCSRCKLNCEHIYCMREYRTDLPSHWCCETCESSDMVSSDTSAKEEQPKAVRFDLSTKVQHNSKESASRSSLSKGARRCWQEKEVGRGKTKYLSTEEVRKMATGSMVKRDPRFRPSRKSEQLQPSILSNTHINLSRKKIKDKSCTPSIKEHAQMNDTSSIKDIQTNPTEEQKRMGETSGSSQISIQNAILSPAMEHNQLENTANVLPSAKDIARISGKLQKTASKESCASLLSIYCQTPIMSGISSIRRTERNNRGAEDKTIASIVFTVEDFYRKIATEKTLPTDPSPDASWMGSFKLKDEQTSISFKAHPSSKCRRKVSDFSKRMPKVLEFELLPYQDFLINVFEGYTPDEKDIGLYFFPHNIGRSNTYKSQLEHLSEQLYMRSCINGVELFVFTSKVLREDSHQLNKYDFLWGVYRPVKHKGEVTENMVDDITVDAQESNTIAECTEVLEMEVDMIGGQYVGRLDVVVRKQSSFRISGMEATAATLSISTPSTVPGIPPGFDPSSKMGREVLLNVRSLSREMGNDVPPGFGSLSGGKRNDIPPGFSARFKNTGAECDDIPPGFIVPYKIKKEYM